MEIVGSTGAGLVLEVTGIAKRQLRGTEWTGSEARPPGEKPREFPPIGIEGLGGEFHLTAREKLRAPGGSLVIVEGRRRSWRGGDGLLGHGFLGTPGEGSLA